MEATHPTPAPQRRRRRTTGTALGLAAAIGIGSVAAVVPATTASAGTTPARPYLVSRDHLDLASSGSVSDVALDGSGRFVAFSTNAKLVPEDTNTQIDVYLRDRWAGETELISVATNEALGNATSHVPSISDDGRYVAFRSASTVWGGPATAGRWNIWVRDRVKGTTARASLGHGGDAIGADADDPVISGNGRFVVFNSKAANIVSGDSNAASDVFVRDLITNTNERVSVSSLEGQSLDASTGGSISDDGRYVAFWSREELAGGRADDAADVFVRDRTGGSTANAHLTTEEVLANGEPGFPEISGNGRYVAYTSQATNLVAGDTNAVTDVFRRDLQTGTTTRASIHDNDAQLATLSFRGGISDDGNQISFSTGSTAVSGGDAGSDMDVFVRTISTASTRRVSTSTEAPDPVGTQDGGALSDDGSHVGFTSFVPSGNRFTSDHPVQTQQAYVSGPLAYGPFPTAGAFVAQQFTDILGRPVTGAESNGWQARFLSGEAHPAQLISDLVAQDAFAAKRAPVVRLYWAFFLRKPDTGGLSYWISKYQGGASLASIAQKFSQSSEFKNRYGSVGNGQYVKLVYQNVFDRQPDADGLAFWTGKLDRKEISRGQVLVNFSESSEGKRRLAPQVHIILTSLAMLRAVPSADLFTSLLAAYGLGEDEGAYAAQKLLVSGPYAARIDPT